MDKLGEVKAMFPTFAGGSGSLMSFITYICLIILLICVVSAILVFFLMRKKYKYKVIIFERINGQFEPTIKDRGCILKHGKAGDEIFYLRKLKKYQPMPTFQTGRNVFWFWKRDDGELIDMSPGDFDEQARQVGAKFLDKEMRYARTSLQETFKERYHKPKFLEKYGAILVNVTAMVLIMVFLWLIIDKILASMSGVENLLAASEGILERVDDILIGMDNVCTGGYIQ